MCAFELTAEREAPNLLYFLMFWFLNRQTRCWNYSVVMIIFEWLFVKILAKVRARSLKIFFPCILPIGNRVILYKLYTIREKQMLWTQNENYFLNETCKSWELSFKSFDFRVPSIRWTGTVESIKAGLMKEPDRRRTRLQKWSAKEYSLIWKQQ